MKTPLVYSTKRAAMQAKRLLPAGTILENAVEESIVNGDLRHIRGEALVQGEGWAARCRRDSPRIRARRRPRAWLVLSVEPQETVVRHGEEERDVE